MSHYRLPIIYKYGILYYIIFSEAKMKEALKNIIVQFHEQELPGLLKRDLVIKPNKDIITVLYGLRRVGKTFMIYQTINELIESGVDRRDTVYINFEDERIDGFGKKNFQEILEAYYDLYPDRLNSSLYLFFDEIQYVEKWDLFIKRIYESKKHSITVTGSSAKLLSMEIATSLRGRTAEHNVKPLNFSEFLRFKGFSYDLSSIQYSRKVHQLRKLLREYLLFGGYPVVVKTDNALNKKEIIRNYLGLTIYRDLVDRFNLRSSHLLNNLIRYLVHSLSKFFSVTRYHKFVRQEANVSKETITDYAGYLQEIGFVTLLEKYSKSLKEKQVNPKKVMIFDNGVCSLYLDLDGNIEKLMENIVYSTLSSEETYYYKTKSNKEIDFYIPEKKIFVQVCFDLRGEPAFQRELSGLCEALSENPGSKGILITLEEERRISYEYQGGKYSFKTTPLWKWLLK